MSIAHIELHQCVSVKASNLQSSTLADVSGFGYSFATFSCILLAFFF